MTKGGEVLKNNYTVSSRKRFLFYILMILSLLCIMALQFFGQNERDGNTTEKNLIYQGTFTWQKSDGSSEKISVPGQYDVKAKDTMTILTRLRKIIMRIHWQSVHHFSRSDFMWTEN